MISLFRGEDAALRVRTLEVQRFWLALALAIFVLLAAMLWAEREKNVEPRSHEGTEARR